MPVLSLLLLHGTELLSCKQLCNRLYSTRLCTHLAATAQLPVLLSLCYSSISTTGNEQRRQHRTIRPGASERSLGLSVDTLASSTRDLHITGLACLTASRLKQRVVLLSRCAKQQLSRGPHALLTLSVWPARASQGPQHLLKTSKADDRARLGR